MPYPHLLHTLKYSLILNFLWYKAIKVSTFIQNDLSKASAEEVDTLKQEVARLTASLAVKDSELTRCENQLRRVERKYEESQADVQMLEELGRFLTSSLAIEQVIEHIYQSFNVLDAEVFLIGLLDKELGVINVPLLMAGNKKMDAVQINLDDKSSPAVWCIENQRELVVLEAQDNADYFPHSQINSKLASQMGSIVYQPLMVGNEVVGCLSVQNGLTNGFNKEQLDTIRILSAYSSIAVANALGYQRLAKTVEVLKSTQNQLVLQEKMASLGTLTAGVAHEINNPVNFSHVGAENLSVDLLRFESFLMALADEDADPDILQALHEHFVGLFEHIATIKTGTRRIKSIVQDLRSFTHIDASDVALVDVNESIHSTINLIRSQKASVARFVTDLRCTPQISCYPAKLNQVIMNIISNAFDAIAQKQKDQEKTILGEIHITCQVRDDKLEIRFADDGCGMDEQTRRQIFEPFFTTKEVGQGTGLGMAVVFGIIEEHGGDIEVESTVGEGTMVRVMLPLIGKISPKT